VSTITKYWPAFVAGLYLAYVVASGNTSELGTAISAFLATLGLSHSVASAHAKIDRI
jgi:hypothetical protein